MFQFCYLYLYLNNTFGFSELSASTIFFPKENTFLQTSIEGFKPGQLLPFLGTCTVKERLTYTTNTTVPFHFPKELPADKVSNFLWDQCPWSLYMFTQILCFENLLYLKTVEVKLNNICSRNNFLQRTDKSPC